MRLISECKQTTTVITDVKKSYSEMITIIGTVGHHEEECSFKIFMT